MKRSEHNLVGRSNPEPSSCSVPNLARYSWARSVQTTEAVTPERQVTYCIGNNRYRLSHRNARLKMNFLTSHASQSASKSGPVGILRKSPHHATVSCSIANVGLIICDDLTLIRTLDMASKAQEPSASKCKWSRTLTPKAAGLTNNSPPVITNSGSEGPSINLLQIANTELVPSESHIVLKRTRMDTPLVGVGLRSRVRITLESSLTLRMSFRSKTVHHYTVM